MKCRKYIQIIALLGFTLTGPLYAAEEIPLLPEGLEFRQVEGTARLHERTKAWRFVTAKTLTEKKLTVPEGTELTILPGSALDKIIAYAAQDQSVSLRIDAVITQYRKTNFLFLFDAAPLTAAPTPPAPAEPAPKEQAPSPKEETANIIRMASDPNETSVIPPEILQRMLPAQRTDFARMEQAAQQTEIVGDTMIVSRTGRFLRRQNGSEFILDGFGRSISGRSFTLLPCKSLQQVEKEIGQSLDRHRYRVSGVVTTFRGKQFLLLQGAVRTYTHGNFTP
jgi:hypothetical protein